MKDLGAALAGLEPQTRALLELSLRRGMPDDEIAQVIGSDREEVARRRAAALESLAKELRLDGREQQDELLATLPDLPAGLWKT